MFKNPKTRKRISAVTAVICVLSLLVGVTAYFTDRESASAGATAGNMDMIFTDISASSSGTNGITSNNEFAQDKAWKTSIVSDGAIINPGDYFDLSYELTNTGSKSMDIRQQLTVTSTVPMTGGAEEYQLTITGGNDATKVTGTLSDDKLSITYDLTDIILDGSVETEEGATDGKYIVRLDFLRSAGNALMGSGVTVFYKAQAKQHRNTDDNDWAAWAEYETKFEQILETDAIIPVYVTDSEGNDLNASSQEIIGEQKEDLLSKLEQSGLVDSADNVVALIDVDSDDFDDLATTTFDVSEIAQEGDKVVIFHFDETTQEWEYISEETVDAEGKVTADFSSFSPVAFVVVKPVGSTALIGLYDADDNLLASWDSLVNDYGLDVEVNYTDSNYRTAPTSMYFILNNYDELSTGVKLIMGDGVAGIGDQAFRDCVGLTSVTIPDSVTSIGASAFQACLGLTSATIPDSVTNFSTAVFWGCSGLTNVTIGNGVTSIGYNAFCDCTSLTSVTIPDSVTSIGRWAFGYGKSLTSVTFGENSQLTSIDPYAFRGCEALTSVTIPDSVTSIGKLAFWGCSGLTSLTIGSGLTSIGELATDGCPNLTSISVAPGNTTYHSAGNCLIETESKTLIIGCQDGEIPSDGSVTSIGDFAFVSRNNLTSVTIPGSVTNIGYKAFYSCPNLTSVTIGSGVTIGNGVTSIGREAFWGCTSLTSVTIGSGVTSIGYEVFYNCPALKSAIFENTNGWFVANSDTATSGTPVTALTLTNASSAAGALRSTYCSWYWKCN